MKNKYVFILLFFTMFLNAQRTHRIDSLKNLITVEKHLKKKALSLLELARFYQRTDRDTSRFYSDKALKIARELKDDSLIAASYFRQAYPEYYISNDDVALQLYNKIDTLALKNDDIYNILIETKLYRAEISKFTLTHIGVLKARTYLHEGLDIAQKHKNQYHINRMTQRLSAWHEFIAQEENPEKHLDTAKTLSLKVLPYFIQLKDWDMTATTYGRLAAMEHNLKNLIKSDFYRKKEAEALRLKGDSMKIARFYYKFGSSYIKRPEKEIGLKYLDSAKTIYDIIGYPNATETKKIYRDYGYLYSQNGNFKLAYENMQKALVQSYTAYQNSNTKNAQELEAKYQTEKKEQEIALLKSQNELVEQQKKNQRNMLLGGLGITSIAGIFLFVLYINRQKTNNKLREIDTLKTNFFTNISHEFRTPLTLISAPIQDSLEDQKITDQKRKHFEIAQKSTKRLSSLVDQLLELSKIDSGNRKLLIQKNTPTQMIAAWVESFLYLAQQKEIDFKTDISNKEVEVWFDREALENIVVNLLGNAVKYTPNGGEISIITAIKNGFLNIKVKNTGKGISSSQIKTIFNRFYQTDDQNEGVGVGLSLVKELTDLHGGKIKVTSEPHKWTLFEVSLAIDKTKLKNAVIKEIPDSLPIGKTQTLKPNTHQEENNIPSIELPILLVVEDNEDVRTLLTDTFKKEYEVVQAVNGEEGIIKAIDLIPDIIISDLMMPLKDGIELTKTLKEDERTSHIPVILLTAKAGDENELTGIDVGADDYITKPFNQKILKSKTASLVELRKKLQSRYSQEVILKPKDIAITSVDEKFLERVQTILDEKLVESTFTTEEFSKNIHMSRMQLHRKLKALTGLSTSEFLRSQRLKLAARILKQSDINVSQVGYSVGFNDHAYFSKCFKEVFSSTPSEFASKK